LTYSLKTPLRIYQTSWSTFFNAFLKAGHDGSIAGHVQLGKKGLAAFGA